MAHLTYPYTITPNTLASASQVMGNFDAIKAIINGGIDSTNLADKAVTAGKLADKAVNTSALADEAVTEAKLDAGAVTTAKLADAAVTSAKLADGSVTSAKLAANAVTTEKIAAGAVTANQLANAAVTAAKIVSGAVGSTKLADAAVTSTKLGAGAVTSTKIAPGAVQMAHLGEMWIGRVFTTGELSFGPEGFTATKTTTGRYTVSYSLSDGNYVAFIQPRVSSGVKVLHWVSATKSSLTVEITDLGGTHLDATFDFLLIRVPEESAG